MTTHQLVVCDMCGATCAAADSDGWRQYQVVRRDYEDGVALDTYNSIKADVCPKCSSNAPDQSSVGFLRRLLGRKRR